MTVSNQSDYLKWAETSKNNLELSDCYDEWAGTYEQDVSQYGYHKVLSVITGLIISHIKPGNGKMLEAGAGTGILGEILYLLGYDNIIGIDLSKDMLGMAEKKGVYHSLKQMAITGEMDFPDNNFHAVISLGVFTAGSHIPSESFDEFIRITQPGGYVIFSIRTEIDQYKNYKVKHDALEASGKWRLQKKIGPFQSLPLKKAEAEVMVAAYTVL